jgi:Flp pilus assembly protein TadD
MAQKARHKRNVKPGTNKNNKGLKTSSGKFVVPGMLLLIILFAFAVFSNCLHNDILNFDDVEYFQNYPEVLSLTSANILKYFTSYYVIMYQPIPVLTFALNYHFTALDVYWLHLVNLLFHLANTALVFLFIRKLSGRNEAALIAAALFAVHPMNVEAVSWISARSSSMFTLFYLAALLCYLMYLEHGKRRFAYLAGCAIFFLLSLFSKAQAVTLPVILVGIDLYYKRKLFTKWNIIEKVPFFALSVVFGLITLSDLGTMTNLTQGMLIHYNPFDIFLMVCTSFVFYIGKLFVPVSQCAVYVYPPKVNGWLPLIYYIAPIILAIVGWLLYKASRKRRYVLAGLFFFLVTISINIQLIPSRLFIVTDRYGYLPYVGLFFIIASFYCDVKDGTSGLKRSLLPWFSVLLVGVTLIFGMLTWQRNKVWKNDIVFMTDILDKNPSVPYLSRAYGTRANAYLRAGNAQQAIQDFSKAIEVKSDEAESWFNRGITWMKIQDYKSAVTDLEQCDKLKPNTAIVLCNLGVARYNNTDYKGALDACNKALKLDSTLYDAYNARAASRFSFNDYEGAEKDFTKCISLKPNDPAGYRNRGNLYLRTNRASTACYDWKKAKELGSADVDALISQYCN